jgi:hypothetical protein
MCSIIAVLMVLAAFGAIMVHTNDLSSTNFGLNVRDQVIDGQNNLTSVRIKKQVNKSLFE